MEKWKISVAFSNDTTDEVSHEFIEIRFANAFSTVTAKQVAFYNIYLETYDEIHMAL